MNLDRFSWGNPDSQQESPITRCAVCSGDIYRGELVYVADGHIIHYDGFCLLEYAHDQGIYDDGIDCLDNYFDICEMPAEEALGVA